MATLSPAEIASYALRAGVVVPSRRVIAVAVALAESGGRTDAHNLSSIEDSRGLWQINARAHPILARGNLYNPMVNALAMSSISVGGLYWGAWTTYTGGAYQGHLGVAAAAVKGVSAGGRGGPALTPSGRNQPGKGLPEGFSFAHWIKCNTYCLGRKIPGAKFVPAFPGCADCEAAGLIGIPGWISGPLGMAAGGIIMMVGVAVVMVALTGQQSKVSRVVTRRIPVTSRKSQPKQVATRAPRRAAPSEAAKEAAREERFNAAMSRRYSREELSKLSRSRARAGTAITPNGHK